MKKKLMFGMTVLFIIIAVIFIGCPEENSTTSGGQQGGGGNPGVGITQNNPATLEDDNDVTLTATVPNESEVAGYQWYVNTTNNNNTGTKIEGATDKSYEPPSDKLGGFYYYVVVTFKNGTTTKSNPFKVIVNLSEKVNATTPSIITPPATETKYATDDIAAPLTVLAIADPSYGPPNGTYAPYLSYQWYSNAVDNNVTGTAIEGARLSSYTPPTTAVSTMYYYVVITNTIGDNGDGGNKTATKSSATAKVVVEQGAKVPTFTTQPISKEDYPLGASIATLVVAAVASDTGTITYQWYRYKMVDNMPVGEEILNTGSSCLPVISEKSTWYYYCEATNTIQIGGVDKTKSAKSNSAVIGVGTKAVQLSGVTIKSRPYDTGNKAAEWEGTPVLTPNLIGDVALVRGTAVFADSNAGTHNVTLVNWYLTGEDKDDYVLKLQTGLTGTIIKAAGSDVVAPELDRTTGAFNPTSYKITVRAGLADPSTEQAVEYAKDTTNNKAATALTWQASPIFTGLTVSTKYYIYARAKESANYQAGKVEVNEGITTVPGSELLWNNFEETADSSSITVTAPALKTATGQIIEYEISRLATGQNSNAGALTFPQTTPVFTGLDGGTRYYVYARAKANSDWSVGAVKKSDEVWTSDPIVSFDTHGAGQIPSQTIEKGNPFSQSSIPAISRERYEFDWWYKDADYLVPYNFADPVNSNITLHAKWINVSEKNSQALKNMVYVKGGWYKMGTTDATVSNAVQHDVGISGFWMGKYEVTQEEWQKIMGSNPSKFKTAVNDETETPGKLPVENVSWYAALVYCNKRSMDSSEGYIPAYKINGSTDPSEWGAIPTTKNATWDAVTIVDGADGYRLPTEAQWEYACRAGTSTKYSTGDEVSTDTGWYGANSNNMTHKVGSKPSSTGNAWGLYDMHGNVMEWCWDWYDAVYDVNKKLNPTGPNSVGTYRVARGGFSSKSQDDRSMSDAENLKYLPSYFRVGVVVFLPNNDGHGNKELTPFRTLQFVGLRVVRP
jgi:formylglycine-generating enzyme required for sulfatase activity